jgi:two-component system response regulator PilR (NtrC family)
MKPSDRRGADPRPTVLIIDDEADLRELVELTMLRMGLAVKVAESVTEAKSLIDSGQFDLCLTDMRLPDGEGLDVVRYIAAKNSDLPVAVITAYGNTENAVAALKAGAFDYVSKPLSLDQLRTLVKSALRVPNSDSRAEDGAQTRRLLGGSPPIEQVRQIIVKLSRSQAPVYITGESGSGKELAARLIHEGGARRDKAFVPVNCGAIPESLMESEFFGYRKGAFTGAGEDREGFFHAANGGTLFLDEVADLPLGMQVKLLRAIQEKRVRKVGATVEDAVDVRIICATHQNLQALIEAGKFRQDLYYRLAVIELRMPSLRECREDIPVLANAILARLGADSGNRRASLSPSAIAAVAEYEFPGNARELENILERAIALSTSDEIQVEDLQLAPPVSADEASEPGDETKRPLQEYLDRVEREAILEALGQTRFNRTQAAKNLGITFRALRYRMERLRIKEAE